MKQHGKGYHHSIFASLKDKKKMLSKKSLSQDKHLWGCMIINAPWLQGGMGALCLLKLTHRSIYSNIIAIPFNGTFCNSFDGTRVVSM